MRFTLFQLADAMQGRIIGQAPAGAVVEHLITDSRHVAFASTGLFFALRGPGRDGHAFIAEAYRQGVRYFVVGRLPDGETLPEACFIQVADTLEALQMLASWRRSLVDIPVIGITGSNGKTIVKDSSRLAGVDQDGDIIGFAGFDKVRHVNLEGRGLFLVTQAPVAGHLEFA